MQTYDTIVIGFGKAGKTLAATLSKKGQKVALIERSAQMYGGTCINIACIPTKTLEFKSRKRLGGLDKNDAYRQAIAEKTQLITALRGKNYAKIAGTGATIIDGEASFVDPQTIEVKLTSGAVEQFTASQFVINTGASSVRLPISGLEASARVYTSETLLDLAELPEHLVIVGASYIGLEFASIYANFGAKVTVLQRGGVFLPAVDRDIAAAIKADLEARGVRIVDKATVLSGREDTRLHLTVSVDGQTEVMDADALLLAVGRKPATAALHLDRAGVATRDDGSIVTDETLKTTNPRVWAAGDVKGGEQFTYISLDDFRIILSQMLGDKSRTTQNRGPVPHTMFIDPPYASIGLSEEAAKAAGLDYVVSKLPVAAIPKAHILEEPKGLLKLILEKGSEKILGAHFYAPESHEVIGIIEMAMKAGLPYSVVRQTIFAHPTMAEALNDL